jgi:7-keto-8-aminopelargonate synthetase-like enzyme
MEQCTLFKEGTGFTHFNLIPSESPIIPILIGDAKKAVDVSKLLYKKGILIPAIRPPTVPARSSRLRMTVMSTHTRKDLERLLEVLSDIQNL